jgi:AraC family transcriptional activator of pobA
MRVATEVPVYKLYGERDPWPTPDMVHCETIAARSKLHNWQIRPHQHHGLFQILYLQSGSARIRLDDCYQRMGAGQLLTVPQMCIHGFEFDRDAEGYVITLAYPLISKISRALGERLPLPAGPRVHGLDDGGDGALATMALETIAREYRSMAPHRESLIEAMLSVILIWLHRNAAQSVHALQQAVNRGEKHFSRFCRLIEAGYAQQRSVADYAREIGITAAHLNVLCRQAVGQSALDLIHERVLLEAKRSLVYTSMTISVVSYALGFSDPAYFTRFFKRRTGLSPRNFRLQATTALEPEA